MRTRRIRSFAPPLLACAALILFGSEPAKAHGPYGTLSEPAYREMRQLARDLDGQAQHAADQAWHSSYSIYTSDRGFVRAVTSFAKRARQFDYRMGTYRTQPWQVDDELGSLLRSARDVQRRARYSRFVDDHSAGDWDQVVNVLNRMIEVYQSDVSGGPQPYDREPYGSPPYRGGSGAHGPGGYGYSGGDLVSLARELDARATRAHELAERLATSGGPREQQFFESIHHFNDQARDFRQRIESGGFSDPRQIRGEAAHLLDDARDTDRQMRNNNVFPEVWQEWQGAMQVLQRIVNQTGA